MEIRDAMCWERWQESPPARTERTGGREAPGTLGDFGDMPPAQWLRQGLGPHPAACPLQGLCLPRTLYRTRSCSPSRSVVPSGHISFTKAMEKMRSLLSLAGGTNAG